MNLRKKTRLRNKEEGIIVTLVLIFGAIFVLMFGSLLGFLYTQSAESRQKVAFNEALSAAEAGANYARWHLAHAPSNYNFSGTYDLSDPEGGVIGHYSLQISSSSQCSTVVDISSTGWTDDFPSTRRTVDIKYGKPSLAQYAFLTNTDVWFGPTEDVKGPLHSNGGIRMDGTQNALFTSATSTYHCLPAHGCSSPYQTKPGIWGAGAGGAAGLWSFPVSAVDFNAITVNLADLKTTAQNGGYYFASSTVFGYHVVLKDDGSFDLFKVTKLMPAIDGEDTQLITHHESNDISTGIGSFQLMVEKGVGQQALKPTTDNLTGTYASYNWQMNTNPFTGSAWTLAEVNNWTTNFGVQRVDLSEGTPRVTQISGSVSYTSSGSPTFYPSAIGNYDQWTANSGTKTNAVGSPDSDDTTYISASANNQVQTFIMQGANVPLSATVNSVSLNVVSREVGGDANIKLRVEKGSGGGSQSDGSSLNLISSYATYTRLLNTNPFTGSAWTVAEVNNWATTRFGVIRSNNNGGTPRVTQIYVVVSYTLNGTVSLAPVNIANFDSWNLTGTSTKVLAVGTNDSDTSYIDGLASSETFKLAGAGLPAGATINSVTLNVVAKGIFGNAETFVGNYPLSVGQCNAKNLIFLEDKKVWVEGVTSQAVTVAAAQFPDNPNTNSSIIINGSITRSDPSVTLPAFITQNNILVPYYSPDNLEIDGVLVAQKGSVERYYYAGNTKTSITVRGSIITNNVWTWNWNNPVNSGYINTLSYYEPALIYNPPPYFPTSGSLQFVSWQEKQ